MVEWWVNTIHQFKIVTKLFGIFTNEFLQFRTIDVGERDSGLYGLDIGLKKVKAFRIDVVNTLEIGTIVDWPAQWIYTDLKLSFYIVEQFEGILGRTIKFINENNHR